MKQLKTYAERANHLKIWWETEGKKLQDQYVQTLPEKVQNRVSRNRDTHGGWIVPGIAGITRVIHIAGLPYNNYWSGYYPTPSTQIPKRLADYAMYLKDNNWVV